jgi:glycosyltransferase involved in cell wall biosynthesis
LADAPQLSVIVPSVNHSSLLEATLGALEKQDGGCQIEVLVPERTGEEARSLLEQRFPSVTPLPLPSGTTIPAMRRVAFEAAKAPVVAVIEDHVIVPPDWASRFLDAVTTETPVVGGWVHNSATERLVDRAAFLCEYGHMLVPLPSGSADWVTGNNVAYHRSILDRYRDVISEEKWENHLHDAIREGGTPLIRARDIDVAHKMHYRSAWEYAGQRYLYSRAYAGMRLRDAGRAKALAYGLAAFVLPPVLLARIVKSGWSVPEARLDLVKALPLLSLFVSAWALGEMVGAWAGPGDALGRVR